MVHLLSGQDLIYECPNQDTVVNVTAVYIAQQFKGELRTDKDEADELRFFNLSQLPTAISPPDRPVIERYLDARSLK